MFIFGPLLRVFLHDVAWTPRVRKQTACSFGWWLVAGAGLFGEKSIAGWLLVAGLL
jgi:hypothetical protein